MGLVLSAAVLFGIGALAAGVIVGNYRIAPAGLITAGVVALYFKLRRRRQLVWVLLASLVALVLGILLYGRG